MKRSLNILALVSVMALAGACGKNKSDSSSSSSFKAIDGLSVTSAQALVNFDNWYRSAQEGSGSPGMYLVDRRQYTASYGNGCEVDDIEIFGVVIGQWYNCNNFNSTGGGTSASCKVAVSYDYNSSLKALNPTLAALRTGAAGVIVEAIQSGSIFTIQVQKASGYVVSYVIDTSYHSAFQPVMVTDYEAGKVTKLMNIQYNPNPSLPTCGAL